MGKKPVRVEIQLEFMDQELRNSLWNAFKLYFLDRVCSDLISSSSFRYFFPLMWDNFFKEPVDTMENYFRNTYDGLRERFFKWEWFEVYDFLEYLVQAESPADRVAFTEYCNVVLKRELSGYRFVGNKIVAITNEEETQEIEEALKETGESGLNNVHVHLKTSLSKLSDRKSPDYRNSIKESISAVEAISRIITGDPKAELGQALKVIEDKVGLHGALKKGFLSIYGYTSDSDGIRHALSESSTCDYEDAKFMLISCSAFINYLIVKSKKAKIRL